MVDIAELVLRSDSGQFMESADAMDEVTAASRRTTSAVSQSGAAMRTGGQASRNMGGAMRFLQVHNRQLRGSLQNTAFQLQDIIVQLEMGVPLTRTLAQQLPQLAGSWGAVGAAVGAVVGGLFAFGPLLIDTGTETKSFSKELDKLSESFEAVDRASKLSALGIGDFDKELGVIDERLASVLSNLEAFAQRNLAEALGLTFRAGAVEQGVTFREGRMDRSLRGMFEEDVTFGGASAALQRNREVVAEMEAAFRRMADTELIPEERLATAFRIRDAILSAVEANGRMDEQQRDFLVMLDQMIIAIQEGIRKEEAAREEAHNNEFTRIQLRIQAAQMGLAKEEEAREQAHWDEFARIQFRIQAVQQGVAQEAAQREAMMSSQQALMVRLREEGEQLADELFEAWESGKDLGELDIASGIDAAAVVAGELAERLGISLAAAQAIVALGSGGVAGGRGNINPDRTDILGMQMGGIVLPSYRRRRGGSGGDGPSPMERIEEEIRRREKALELGREELELLEAIWDIEDRLGDDREKHSDEYIANLAREMLALEEREQMAEDMRERLDQIGDTMKSAMEDAFMSMIDGTKSAKEAFRDMARSIIAELFRILVVQQLVGNFEAGGGGILGGLFDGLNFEGGGNTPPGPRTGGLDGRGGMLAMVHPNETIIDNTRPAQAKQHGTTQETIIVKQDINVTTGVQQTVRAEILALMPRIAEQSKMAVLDAKQRGGAFGRAL